MRHVRTPAGTPTIGREADTTRARVVTSGPMGALVPPPPRAVGGDRDTGHRHAAPPELHSAVRQAREVAEVAWGVAATLRRALGPDAAAWVSTALRVDDGGRVWRPHVAVAADPLPLDGRGVPALVVEVGPRRPVRQEADWLACGVREVWRLDRCGVTATSGTASRPVRRFVDGGEIELPLGGVRVDVTRLCAHVR